MMGDMFRQPERLQVIFIQIVPFLTTCRSDFIEYHSPNECLHIINLNRNLVLLVRWFFFLFIRSFFYYHSTFRES